MRKKLLTECKISLYHHFPSHLSIPAIWYIPNAVKKKFDTISRSLSLSLTHSLSPYHNSPTFSSEISFDYQNM